MDYTIAIHKIKMSKISKWFTGIFDIEFSFQLKNLKTILT